MLETEQTLLKRVGLIEEAIADRPAVRQALYAIRPHCNYQIFGICADNAQEAIAALNRYTDVLGYPRAPELDSCELDAMQGPMYLKYNPKTDLYYLNPYEGNERGVIISCQSVYDDGIRDTYGHFPLDLFDEISPEEIPEEIPSKLHP
ncbi:DUF1824 family protein [Geitlerinema sp. P-1104]|uniref:DUF1824 family protein n=1 Tax=Geitlerinema sp. P-1104 TaxID=2546230 RepID=UPI001477288D|nr:DUF1824 family protein [Geitlerinema sp. P-1104]NMG58226.1 DUF1824 family protein [Geitlerinema sp. P-1104]